MCNRHSKAGLRRAGRAGPLALGLVLALALTGCTLTARTTSPGRESGVVPALTGEASQPVSPTPAVAATQAEPSNQPPSVDKPVPAAAVAAPPTPPSTQPAGPPIRAEFTMPGEGRPGDQADPNARKLAAQQAAVVVAIYNVTKELNPQSYSDPVEDGLVNCDHFRYNAGLEVKSQTVVINQAVRQFDIWLIVPGEPTATMPDSAAEPPSSASRGKAKLQVHVRNFALVGPPLDQAQLDRLLAAAGGHLIVLRTAGPDQQGYHTADVGLVRRPGDMKP